MAHRRSLIFSLLAAMLFPAGSTLAASRPLTSEGAVKTHPIASLGDDQSQISNCRSRQQLRRSNYRGSRSAYYRRRNSTLKTALTIAAPAAIGAGVGALAGGGKGAAVGALLGGGGGALYHLIKRR